MESVISLIQIILAILLVLVILVQQKGSGLGSAFGGEASFYRSRRGAEKLLFQATIVLSVVFILSSLVSLAL